MRSRSRSFRSMAALALCKLLAASLPAWAGGPPSFAFKAPDVSGTPKASSPVLEVHAFSCHVPTDAAVKAYAEGMINGERRTIPLKLERTGTKGVYNLSRQWPAQGAWALVFSIDHGGQTTALVKLDDRGSPVFEPGSGTEGGQVRASTYRSIPGAATSKDIDAVLMAKMAK